VSVSGVGLTEPERRVALDEEAREVARAEAQAVLAAVQDDERRSRLADLLAAVDEGAVDGDEAQALGEVLELGLQTGRVRALYGPDGEQAALKVYRRLPVGRELGDAAKDVNAALRQLEGRIVEKVTVAAVGPGAHTVTISTDGLELSIRLGRKGATLGTVAV
jgi:hypothetical protein